MQCPVCQTINAEGARFCFQCGNPLTAACPSCHGEVTPGSRFCPHCGNPLTAPAPADPSPSHQMPADLATKLQEARARRTMVGERRIVTILFCDVKGSTALADQLDPEEWTEIMNGAFEHLIAPVYRYEGTLARLLGDAILAFFGAPIAHEDDPQRAILAGLEILDRIRGYRQQLGPQFAQDFDVRIGINTGLVVVGEVGSDLRVEYTAMGEAVNLAARMEQTAQPGTVQITDRTYRLVESLFDVQPLGPIAVKGKAEPVAAYHVLRPRPGAVPGRGIAGLRAPLVGRDRELSVLRAAVDDLYAGRGQIVSVIGEAGLGKSRLIAELRALLGIGSPGPPAVAVEAASAEGRQFPAARAAPSAAPVRSAPRLCWYEGRAFSYESSIPLTPFKRLLSACLGLDESESDAQRLDRIQARVAELMPDSDSLAPALFAKLLGIPLTTESAPELDSLPPQQLQERLFRAIAGLIERIASSSERGLVVVLEDLHWADSTSVALLEQLLPLVDRTRLLIIALFRPQREEAAWRFHEVSTRSFPNRYTPVLLEPLNEDCSRALVAGLLQVDGLSERARSLILHKAEGNPFFIEEVIRSLLDSRLIVRDDGRWRATHDLSDLAVPDTLAGVITSRLDRLEDETKRVAQVAAVIGREFPSSLLGDLIAEREVLDRSLESLERRELIRQVRGGNEHIYSFKHVLTQETVYASILHSQRRELHRLVAEGLERRRSGQPDAYLTELAHHYYRAGIWEKALDYFRQLGMQAIALYAPWAAIQHFTQALDAAHRLSAPVATELYTLRAQAFELVGEFDSAKHDYEEALQAARNAGDRRGEWRSLIGLGFLWLGRDYEPARQCFERALALARTMGEPTAIAHSLNRLGNWYITADDAARAEQYHLEALPIFQAQNDEPGIAATLDLLGMSKVVGADFQGADAYYRQAAERFRRLDDRRGLSASLVMLAYFNFIYLMDCVLPPIVSWPEANRAGEEALELARSIGWRAGEAFTLFARGASLGARGSYAAALESAQEGLTIAQAIAHRQWTCACHCALGWIYLELLDLPAARQHAERARTLAVEVGSQIWRRHPTAVLAETLASEGRFAEALALLDPLPGPTPATRRGGERRLWYARGRLALLSGDAGLALEIADQLIATISGLRPEQVVPRLWALRGEALIALGRYADAEASLRPARELVAAHQILPWIWRIEAALERLYRAQRRVDEAEQAATRARIEIEAIASSLPAASRGAEFRSAALAMLA